MAPSPATDTPPVTRAAMQRALRATTQATGSFSAADLGQRIVTALSTIETSVLAIDAVAERLREAADLAADAARNEDLGRRALLAGRYDDIRAEIDAIAGSASHNRINLISGRRIGGTAARFDIALHDDRQSGISIQVVNLTAGDDGLALSPPRNAFAEDEEIEAIAAEIATARAVAARVGELFADHAALISDRLFRLKKMAGSRPMETRVPTGVDVENEATPEAEDDNPGMAEVEEKLRALAERLKQDGENGNRKTGEES